MRPNNAGTSRVQPPWPYCQQLEKITATDVQLLPANLQVMSTVRDLGVMTDSRMTMADHVTAICMSVSVLSAAPTTLCCAVADVGGSHDARPLFCQHAS